MTASRLTTDQAQAIAPDATIWVAASAGTGKTHILTARLLRLMLEGVAPERLLCLTFTRAAAAQMAGRLRGILAEWSRLGDAALDADIFLRCGLSADAAHRARARRLFAEVLDLPNGLRIDTIHAFCQSLLARFPIEAGLSPHFRPIDEDEARDLLIIARDRAIAQAGTMGRERLADAFEVIAREVNEDDFTKLLSELLDKRRLLGLLLDRQAGYGGLEPLLAATARALDLESDMREETLIAAALVPPALAEDDILRLAEALYRDGTAKEQENAAQLRLLLSLPPDRRGEAYDGYSAVFLKEDGTPRSTTRWPSKKVRKADGALVGLIEEEAARLARLEKRRKLCRVFGFTRAALTVGAEILRHYEAEKHRAGTLDYDDLILASMRLLSQPDIAPWILYKLDAGIDHILVDEAQDTNAEQWAIIEALAEEFYSGAGARAPGRTLFAVGDLKQSIYGFQGAEPDAFLAARDRIFKRAGAAGARSLTVSLGRSFRSTEPVLALVDAVFDDDEAARGLRLDGNRIKHEAERDRDGGLVELWPLEEPETSPPAAAWALPDARPVGASAESRLASRIADHIAGLIGTDLLVSKNRPVEAGDILILVRRRTAFVDLLIKALKKNNVPVAGSDRLKVAEHLAVRDLLAIGAFALLPEDDLVLATVLKGPAIGLDEEKLFSLAHGRKTDSLWSRLKAGAERDPLLREAYDRLGGIRARADLVPPYEFFVWLLSAQGLRRAFAARMGHEVHDPLDEFLALCRVYERERPRSLQGFLHWVSRRGSEIKREQSAAQREVRIMTVHGAKGLESPIVYLPDTCSTPKARTTIHLIPASGVTGPAGALPLPVWRGNSKENECGPVQAASRAAASREDEEYRRLLYVALTRAEDRLYIAGWSGRQNSEGNWYDLISAGFDRLSGVKEVTLADGRTVKRLVAPQRVDVAGKAEAPGEDEGLALPDWLGRPPPEETPPRPLAPSAIGDAPPAAAPFAEGTSAGLQRGRLVHVLLEHLPAVAEAQRETHARSFLAREGLESEAADSIWRDVARILADAEFAPLFGPGSLAEAPIAGRVGAHAVSARIDRLLVTPERILLVDYKTDVHPPARPEESPVVYLRQMAAYRALTRRIWPGRAVRTALLWTSLPVLMTVPDALLDRHAGPFAESGS